MLLSLLISAVMVTNDISYANAKGYWTSIDGVGQDMVKAVCKGIPRSLFKRNLDLTLDLYRPEAVSGKRPLIIFIHGGSFYFGSKQEDAYVDFCRYFTSMGYVTASINYRLGFHFNEKSFSQAMDNAVQDAQSAIEFLTANADEYNVDAEHIFVVGSSSGAITALRLAYQTKSDCRIRAIANLWGAVSDLSIMDGGTASVVSFHGDGDTIVPYGEGHPMTEFKLASKLFPGVMYGSSCIDNKAEKLGIRHKLYTFPGEGHALNKDKSTNRINDNHQFIKDKIAEFFSEELK